MGNWGYNPTCRSCKRVLTARGPPRVLSHTLGKLKTPSNCFCPKGAEWRSGTTPEATGNGDLGKKLSAFIFVISQLISHHKESTKFKIGKYTVRPMDGLDMAVGQTHWPSKCIQFLAFVWYHNFDPWPSFFVQCACVCVVICFQCFWSCSSESTLKYECRTHDMF